jgi:hypothetical protein
MNKHLGDDSTLKMLDGLNLTTRDYLTLGDGDLANLGYGAPNDCGDDEPGSGK